MIPALETLKSIPHWIYYKNEIKADGDKPAKMPKNAHTGRNASSTDPKSWGTFLESVNGQKRYGGDGLGWVFTEDVGIVGIDLDSCIDDEGQIAEWAQAIIDAIHSFTEISPSGKGVHIFAYGKIPKALGPVPGGKIEMYSRDRYFTVTGQMLPGSFDKIEERQEALDNLWQVESKRRRDEKAKQRQTKSSDSVLSSSLVVNTDHLEKYTEKALIDEIATLSMATEGNRNHSLNLCAFNLGQFVEAGLLNQTEIEMTLLSVAMQVGLSQDEAEKTIQSGMRGASSNPRTNWPAPPSSSRSTRQVKQPEPAPELPQNDIKYHEAIFPHLDFVLAEWGLSRETVENFRVGYCGECPTSTYSASFTTPYYESTLVDIRHHLLSPNGQGSYRPEVEGHPRHLFNVSGLDSDWAILVNKEFNTMLLAGEYGLPTVGLPATFKTAWLDKLNGLKKVFVALDPGQGDAARRIGRLLVKRGIDARISTLPFSPQDMLVKYGCGLGDFIRFVEQGWGA